MFNPKRADGRSEITVVYDRLKQMQPGDTVNHDELMALLGTNNKHRLYAAVLGAAKRLRARDQRSVGSVRGVGYRMLYAKEHEEQAHHHQRKGRRQVGTAVNVMRSVDMSALSPAEQSWARKVTAGMMILATALDHQAAKIASHDDMIRELQARVDKLEE